ncbi:thermonuclease family protein [Paenibacillus sp. SC116]|uniref:thermonuclease family protein n=1 Tax=Paenibacillus sp. SC116 TaxID=2968986 RepID=UPI00215B0562|nr:thermonuclease family protein [Paenibacillus sp. SC116]MCR8845311.1 thermonuclease family protein [Paenibacillus sp. SC116]
MALSLPGKEDAKPSTAPSKAAPAATQTNQQGKPATKATENKNRIAAKVTRVIDGDTIEVSFDGKTEDVRLLLVDTPETKHRGKPVQPFGAETSAYAKKILDGKDIELEIDMSERDKYGRLLAYVWIDDRMFNELLLEKGLARVAYVYAPNVKHVDKFREIQDQARQSELGIWSIENYATDEGFDTEVAQPEKPASTPKPAAKPDVKVETTVYYMNCKAAKATGVATLHKGDPSYSNKLDRDGDGVAWRGVAWRGV